MNAILATVLMILSIIWFIIVAQVIFHWLVAFKIVDMRQPIVVQIYQMLESITEPIYRPIRRILPNFQGIDLAPLVVLVIIYFLQNFIRYDLPGLIS